MRWLMLVSFACACGGSSPAARAPATPVTTATVPAQPTRAGDELEVHDRAAAIVPVDGARPVLVGQEGTQRIYRASGDVRILGVRFPAEIDGFARNNVVDYGSAEGGYSAGYNHPDGAYLTAYVYGDGADVDREIDVVKSTITYVHKDATIVAGGPLNFEIKEGDTVVGNLRAHFLRLGYTQDGALVHTDSLVGARDGHYVKIRMTFDPAATPDKLPPFLLLMSLLGLGE